MLSNLNSFFHFERAIGIDLSNELVCLNNDKNILIKNGSAEKLNFDDDCFDIIISCATIEHLDDPIKMLNESYRTLKNKGIIIITTPNPFHDKIATILNYYDKNIHINTYTIKRLKNMLKQTKFNVINYKYFMIFPFFKIPFEKFLERLIAIIGLGRIMSNQIIVARKDNG